ncbi:MAG: hypothetical protein AAGD06_24235 [Acidobacteriota bacterium]
MDEATGPRADSEDDLMERIGHPKGTLAIVAIYGLLFILGWVGLYVFEFLARGTPHL